MLAKAHKLDLRQQVSFFRTAHRVSTEFYTIYSKKNTEKLLFQVIIARGTVKTAVERNSLKRSVYDMCAEFLLDHSSTKLSLVIVIRRKNIPSWAESLHTSVHALLNTQT